MDAVGESWMHEVLLVAVGVGDGDGDAAAAGAEERAASTEPCSGRIHRSGPRSRRTAIRNTRRERRREER
jgi:hypothetical protein